MSLDKINAYIVYNYARLNLTSLVTYQPDFFTIPPSVTNTSAEFIFRGDVFMNPIGY
jgi:hypothetical protein